MGGLVQDVERESLQVLAFRVVQAHGMIDGRPELFYDADPSSGVHRGAENDFLK
jgi:hypothetical protein